MLTRSSEARLAAGTWLAWIGRPFAVEQPGAGALGIDGVACDGEGTFGRHVGNLRLKGKASSEMVTLVPRWNPTDSNRAPEEPGTRSRGMPNPRPRVP